jgi:glutathione S-transferase
MVFHDIAAAATTSQPTSNNKNGRPAPPTSTCTLYHVKRTISSPIVQSLIELGLAHTTIRIQELSFASLKSSEYLQHINPMGTSPAYVDAEADIVMWESGAILDHLLERYDPQGQYWCTPPVISSASSSPKSPQHQQQQQHHQQQRQQQRAKYLQLKQYLIATVYPLVAGWFLRQEEINQNHHHNKNHNDDDDHNDRKQQQQGETDAAAAANQRARDTFRNVMGPYLTRCLGDGPYLMGDQFTVIDMIAAKPWTNLQALQELAAFPTLLAHFQRVSGRPSYQEAYYGTIIPTTVTTTTAVVVPTEQLSSSCSSISSVSSSSISSSIISISSTSCITPESVPPASSPPPQWDTSCATAAAASNGEAMMIKTMTATTSTTTTNSKKQRTTEWPQMMMIPPPSPITTPAVISS